ncbi:MAG: hypothetical protein ONB44_14815 [candidate division KSB1 bacterium]|nr:hypothetical protein [candidate division KSB1 bacterium]MDZ7303399.1 hypothetical protein [candidate division KSB1 bacterium]MDZ7312283.1 hypothetical protein [candidate division KSB1 bacterium]
MKLKPYPKARAVLLSGFLIAVFIFLTGCFFEYEETITIRRDGSGEMAVHYAGDADSDMSFDGIKLSKSEREMREQIEQKFTGPGVRLKNYDSQIKDEDRHVYFTVTFEQLPDLARLDWWDNQRIDAGKNYWKRTLKTDDNDPDHDSRFEEWLKEQIAEELEKHIKLRFTVETAGEITETNARDFTPHRAVWRFDGADFLRKQDLRMRVSWK